MNGAEEEDMYVLTLAITCVLAQHLPTVYVVRTGTNWVVFLSGYYNKSVSDGISFTVRLDPMYPVQ